MAAPKHLYPLGSQKYQRWLGLRYFLLNIDASPVASICLQPLPHYHYIHQRWSGQVVADPLLRPGPGGLSKSIVNTTSSPPPDNQIKSFPSGCCFIGHKHGNNIRYFIVPYLEMSDYSLVSQRPIILYNHFSRVSIYIYTCRTNVSAYNSTVVPDVTPSAIYHVRRRYILTGRPRRQ